MKLCEYILKSAFVLSTYLEVVNCGYEFEKKWKEHPEHEAEFPHAILIYMSRAEEEECSGSLLHVSWVLTAARCMYLGGAIVENDTSLTLYAGVRNRYLRNATSVQTRKSKKLFFHTATGKMRFGLVLVQTDEPFTVNTEMGIFRVFLSHHSVNMKRDDQCNSGSYGFLNWTGKIIGLPFKKTGVLPQECSHCWGNFRKSFPDVNTTSNYWFCSFNSFGQANMCRGDFGAGVICDQTLQAVLINLISYEEKDLCFVEDKDTHKCGELTTRAVYVDICPYLGWLHEHIAEVKVNERACYSSAAKLDKYVTHMLCCLVVLIHIY